MDLAVVHGLVACYRHDNGKLTTICTGNWKENEQECTSLQFVSTASVVNFI